MIRFSRRTPARVHLLALLLVLAAGAFVRFYGLGGQSLWKDETMSVSLSHRSVPQIVENRANDNHVPLYFVFLHYWVRLFGDSESSVRLPSALFGVLAVWLVYRFGCRIADRQSALVAALLLSFSLLNVVHSRETRMYSLVVVLVLWSMLALLRLRRRMDPGGALLYLASSILLLYTHLYGFFFILAQNLYVLYLLVLRRPDRLRPVPWLALQGSLAALFLPWALILIRQLIRWDSGMASNWISVPTLDTLFRSYGVFASSSWPLLILFLLFSLLGIHGLIVRRRASGSVPPEFPTTEAAGPDPKAPSQSVDVLVLLVLWATLPVLTPFLLSQFMSPFYSPRYAIGVTPAIMLLVALGVRGLRPRLARYGAVVVLAVVSLVPLVSHLRYTLGTPYWREATSFINRQALQGETVLVNRGEYVLGLLEYYKLRPDLQVRIYNDDWSPQEAAALIRQDGGEHLWLLVNEMRRRQEITKVIEAEYSLTERSEYQRGVLLLSYKRNGAR